MAHEAGRREHGSPAPANIRAMALSDPELEREVVELLENNLVDPVLAPLHSSTNALALCMSRVGRNEGLTMYTETDDAGHLVPSFVYSYAERREYETNVENLEIQRQRQLRKTALDEWRKTQEQIEEKAINIFDNNNEDPLKPPTLLYAIKAAVHYYADPERVDIDDTPSSKNIIKHAEKVEGKIQQINEDLSQGRSISILLPTQTVTESGDNDGPNVVLLEAGQSLGATPDGKIAIYDGKTQTDLDARGTTTFKLISAIDANDYLVGSLPFVPGS
jgi:hypothetical protein